MPYETGKIELPATPPKVYEKAQEDGIAPMCNEGPRKDHRNLCLVRVCDYILKEFRKIQDPKGIEVAYSKCRKVHTSIHRRDRNFTLGLYYTEAPTVLRKEGLFVQEYTCNSIDDLTNILKIPGVRVLCNVLEPDFENPTNPPGSHWVVAVKNDGDNIVVADSSYRDGKTGGILSYPKEEFAKIFKDETLKSNKRRREYLSGYCMIVSDKEINFPTN